MIAVIFEVLPRPERTQDYLGIAADLKPLLATIDGFISIERFESLTEPGKILSLSFWRDEASVAAWRNLEPHRRAQAAGRHEIFQDYRLRIAQVVRDYGLADRARAPADSQVRNGVGAAAAVPDQDRSVFSARMAAWQRRSAAVASSSFTWKSASTRS